MSGKNSPMPALFVGHGSPMNALLNNSYSQSWRRIGASIPRPRAVLSISAHWYIPGSAVTLSSAPRTIHDFAGFPDELYKVEYPAPGSANLARKVKEILSPILVRLDKNWGLDHGTWSVLKHMFPKADVPIVQLSIDESRPPCFHYELGKLLSELRDDGILIIGSGSLVHNLQAYIWSGQQNKPYDWALRFENQVKTCLLDRADERLVHYEDFGRDAKLSAPTPDHYLPLLHILGLRRKDDDVTFPVEGIDRGAVSMLAVQMG